jgi:hypothetical protein
MTVTLYKQQASRLTQHFADVHKLRLKHASSLEAVAALHGAKDWNTLLAAPAALPNEGDVPLQVPLDQNNAMARLFPQPNSVDHSFCEALLSLQSLIHSDSTQARAIFTNALVKQQSSRGGFVYLNCGNDDVLPWLTTSICQSKAAAKLQVADFSAPGDSGTINPLEGMSARAVADTVLRLLPAAAPDNPGALFYRQNGQRLVQVVADAMLTLKLPVSIRALAQALTQQSTLLELERRLPVDAEARKALALLLDSVRSPTSSAIEQLKNIAGGLAGRLAQLSQGNVGQILSEESSISVRDSLMNGGGVYFRVGSATASAGRVLANLVLAHLEVVLAQTRSNEHVPFTIFVSGAAAVTLWSGRLAALAKSANVGLTFIEHEEPPVAPGPWETDVAVRSSPTKDQADITLRHLPTSRTCFARMPVPLG